MFTHLVGALLPQPTFSQGRSIPRSIVTCNERHTLRSAASRNVPDEHCPERQVRLAVDQQLGKGPLSA